MNKPVCTPPQLNFWIICALFMIVGFPAVRFGGQRFFLPR